MYERTHVPSRTYFVNCILGRAEDPPSVPLVNLTKCPELGRPWWSFFSHMAETN